VQADKGLTEGQSALLLETLALIQADLGCD
jgi:hypothetical protein